jgi:hypothetical protein
VISVDCGGLNDRLEVRKIWSFKRAAHDRHFFEAVNLSASFESNRFFARGNEKNNKKKRHVFYTTYFFQGRKAGLREKRGARTKPRAPFSRYFPLRPVMRFGPRAHFLSWRARSFFFVVAMAASSAAVSAAAPFRRAFGRRRPP